MVRALQAQAAQKVEVTVEGQYRKLEEARKRAAKDGAHAAVIQAISVQNKLFGLEKSVAETTVRMASRSPDAPAEIELSVEEWTRQHRALLLGNGDGGNIQAAGAKSSSGGKATECGYDTDKMTSGNAPIHPVEIDLNDYD